MQKKKGISLIVLVITIIVMIILAGAIIITLNNSGIISKANEAVNKTDEATVKEIAQLAWAEAYADKVRTVEDAEDGTLGFKSRVENALEANNVDLDKYLITVTTKGVEVVNRETNWIQNGTTVTKGNVTLNVGDYVAYDETKGGSVTVAVDTKWQVLGAENGNLLILSEEYVYTLNDGTTLDYTTALTTLENLCAPYVGGEGAVKARCITTEDIGRVSGGYEEAVEEVTFYWDGTTQPYYIFKNGTKGSLGGAHGTISYDEVNDTWSIADVEFRWFEGNSLKKSAMDTTATTDNMKKIVTLKTNSYKVNALSEEEQPKAFKMIYGEYDEEMMMYDKFYWLADTYTNVGEEYLEQGVYFVLGAETRPYGCPLVQNGNGYAQPNYSVRAVVELSKDLVLTGNSTDGWSY